MARPCKSVNVMSKNLTKEEIEKRYEAEERLKGGKDKIKPPTYLTKEQKKIFKYIVKELKESNILTNLDIYILTTCAISINRIQRIEQQLNLIELGIDNKQVKNMLRIKESYMKDFFRCCNELSLSPQSRAKLANINITAEENLEDPLIKVLKGDEDK